MQNADPTVTTGFGREWSTFTQSDQSLERAERERLFAEYFRIFPWSELPAQGEGLDAGCGSGRWAFLVAPRVGRLHVLDASREALEVAKANLAGQGNVAFHYASVSDIPLADHSLDFAYSLGVLHHVPDTAAAVRHICSKLKPDAPFLIYLYYALDNRPAWFRAIWQVTNVARMAIARLPVSALPERARPSAVPAATLSTLSGIGNPNLAHLRSGSARFGEITALTMRNSPYTPSPIIAIVSE